MRFLVDECTGPVAASWLRDQSNDVFYVFDEAKGMDDERHASIILIDYFNGCFLQKVLSYILDPEENIMDLLGQNHWTWETSSN